MKNQVREIQDEWKWSRVLVSHLAVMPLIYMYNTDCDEFNDDRHCMLEYFLDLLTLIAFCIEWQ